MIGVVAAPGTDASAWARAIERHGGRPRSIPPDCKTGPGSVAGLLLCGGNWAMLETALSADLPILGVAEGMQALNLGLGGKPGADVVGHAAVRHEGRCDSSFHRIYISPGSKLAAVVGSGGFVRVNSRHSAGIREAQKGPSLAASAYSLEDGVIEALESPDHAWVIAVQFHPERRREIPPHFDRLFQALVDRASG